MKNKTYLLLVILIVILGFVLRVYKLDKSPPSVNFDEAALGYNAYSIMKTGRDEYGNFLPLSLRSFNDYKPALYAYLSIPFIKLWGLNEVSIRMVSAIAGTVSLLFLYFFLNVLIKNKYLRLFIFLVLSLEPWRLHFSRVAFETNLSASFFIAGSWFLFKFRRWKNEDRKFKNLLLIAVLFGLSAYSYHAARLAVPAFILLLVVDPLKVIFGEKWSIFCKSLFKKRFYGIYVLLLFVILVIPVFMANQSSLVLTRLRQENVFSRYFPFAPRELVGKENVWSSWNSNPIYYLTGLLSGHMLSYISPINIGQRVFHWIRGSVQYVPTFSMFGWIESIIFIFGVIFVIKNLRKTSNRFFVYWIVAGAAPAALTWNWFHPLRSLNLYPALEIIIALGMVLAYEYIKKIKFHKIISTWFIFLFLVSIGYIVCNEYNYSIWENNGEFQPGGFKEGVPILKSLQDDYEEVLIDSPHAQSYIFFLFYQSFPPEIVQQYADIRPKPGIEGDLSFDFYKYKFRKFNWPQQRNDHNKIFWISNDIYKAEIENTPGAKLIMLNNAVKSEAAAIITKE